MVFKTSIVTVPSRCLRRSESRLPRIGPQRDYVRQSGHIWQQHDRNVPRTAASLGFNGDGTVTHIAARRPSAGTDIEGPAVVPPSFGPLGGQIMVADEDGNASPRNQELTLAPLLTPFFQMSSLTWRRKRPRYPEASVHLLRPRLLPGGNNS